MNDLEISKALAIVIGWPLVDLYKGFLKDEVEVWVKERHHDSDWRVFDYRDWSVISPIAERYNCFPVYGRGWSSYNGIKWTFGLTSQQAVALAVIGRQKNEVH